MHAQSQRILLRYKATEGAIASPKHFWCLEQGHSAMQPSPQITPYTLDFAKSQILFTETLHSLEAIPFLYHAQFKQAKRLYTVDYAEAFAWTAGQAKPNAPIFVCGMGRSGTTLLSRALQRLNQLSIYDEPDAFTVLASKPPAIEDLLYFLGCAFQQDAKRLVIKQRGFVSFILREIHSVFPDAKLLFLYRDASAWVASNLRFILRYHFPEQVLRPLVAGMFADYFPKRELQGLSLAEMVASAWLSFMDEAARLLADSVPLLPIHYDDFAANPSATLAKIFDFCDLALDELAHAAEVAQSPSQAGTWLDDLPDVRLNAQQVTQIEALTTAYPKAFRL